MVICKSFISLRAYFFTFQFQATITARQASALRNGIFIVYLMRRISLSRPFPHSLTIVCRIIILELFKLLHSIHIPKKTILAFLLNHLLSLLQPFSPPQPLYFFQFQIAAIQVVDIMKSFTGSSRTETTGRLQSLGVTDQGVVFLLNLLESDTGERSCQVDLTQEFGECRCFFYLTFFQILM